VHFHKTRIEELSLELDSLMKMLQELLKEKRDMNYAVLKRELNLERLQKRLKEERQRTEHELQHSIEYLLKNSVEWKDLYEKEQKLIVSMKELSAKVLLYKERLDNIEKQRLPKEMTELQNEVHCLHQKKLKLETLVRILVH